MSIEFVKAVRIEDIPAGKMLRVKLAGRRILVANVDGCFYAADDRCTHEDASLSRGVLRGEWVKCPLHGSRFNLRTGEVVEDPAVEPLRVYPVRVENGELWVGLS